MREGGRKEEREGGPAGKADKGSTRRSDLPRGRACYAPGAAAFLIRTVVVVVARHDDVVEMKRQRRRRQGGSGGWENKGRPACLWLWWQ